jgi:hypothetical protein
MGFKYEIGAIVTLKASSESGVIVGRAEYGGRAENAYLIQYKAADGRQVEQWWGESAINQAIQ